jgi:hypothetical protein
MEKTSRRDLLAGLAALPALFSRNLLGLLLPAPTPAESDPPNGKRAPGTLRITSPSQSVTRRG